MSLFICYTPLHVLIVKKIIEVRKIDAYCVLYYYEADSEKNRYYFNLLAGKADTALYAHRGQSLKDIFSLFKSLKTLTSKPITAVYSGNIKTIYSRLVLWFFKPLEINTFDDGMANMNLNPDGYFATDEERWFSKLFLSLFAPEFLYKNIKKKLSANYTIYNHPNVFANSIYIDVFGVNQNNSKNEGELKPNFNILLAGVLAASKILTMDEEQRLYERIIAEKSIDMVINHPRQADMNISGHKNISTSIKIAEHQIIELMSEYNVCVYGTFYTTVLANIPAEVKRVNILVAGSKHILPVLSEFFIKLGIENVFIQL